MTNLIEKYKIYFTELFILAFPLIIGNVAQIFIGATDIYIAGKHSLTAIASISIANSIMFTIMVLGFGMLNAISVILSNMRGAKNSIKFYLMPTIIFSQILALFFCLIALKSIDFIDLFHFEDYLVPHIKEYMYITAFSIFGMYLYEAVREFLQSYEIIKFANFLFVLAVFLNLFLNYSFVFGFGIIPEMGIKGLAYATLTVRSTLGIIMLLYVYKKLSFIKLWDNNYYKQIFKIGSPIGISLLLEFLAFNIVTIMVGKISGVLSATHNILTVISSATYMVPFSFATALSVKIAYHYGAGNYDKVKKFAYTGIYISTVFMLICSVFLVEYPEFFINIFTDNSEILQVALPIVIILGFFEIADGFQVTVGGILKGLKKTKTVSACILSGYWLVGLPLGFLLAYKYSMSLKGFWIGILVAIFSMGIIQYIFAYKELKKMAK